MKIRDDDVKSSLDLLDEVIGEFDDGLTSAAESDILLGASVTTPITKRSQRHHRNDRYNDSAQDRISNRINGSNHFSKNGDYKDSQLIEEPIKANVRNLRPPVQVQKKQRDQSAPPYLNGSRSKHLPNPDHRSQVLNHQIDDIFSELTNEIYVEDKRERKSAPRPDKLAKHGKISAKVDTNLSYNGSDPSRSGKNVSAKKRQQGPVDAPPLPTSSFVSPNSNAGSSSGSQSTRHVNDPLPAPPTSSSGGKGVVSSLAAKLSSGPKNNNVNGAVRSKPIIDIEEGTTITEEERRKEELASMIAAKKSVKDQIQSLETRGRDKQIISVRPEDRFQRNRQINHGERFQQEAERERNGVPNKQSHQSQHHSRYRNGKDQPSMPTRSRSENPINRTPRTGAFTYLPETSDGPSTHRSTTPPPVMPEKTKIHLRTNQPQSLNPSLNHKASNQQSSKLRNGMSSNANKVGSSDQSSSSKNKRVKDVKSQNAKAKSSSKKASDNDENIHGRKQYKSSPAAPRLRTTGESRRPNEPLPEIPLNDHESSAKSSLRNGRGSSQMSNNYEVLHTNNSSSPTTGGMPSMQRDRGFDDDINSRFHHKLEQLSHRPHREEYRKQLPSSDYKRSRSIGPLGDANFNGEFSSPASSRTRNTRLKSLITHDDSSPSRYQRDNDNRRGRTRSKSRHANEMEDRFDGGPSSRRQPMTRSHTTIEPGMNISSKNKARNRSIERNGSAVSHINSPPTPIEAQATLEKILPRAPDEYGNPAMGGRMPTRQKSMIDLRDPVVPALWPDHPRNRNLHPPPHLSSSLAPPSLPPQSAFPNMSSRGPSSSMHPGGLFQGGHNHPTSRQPFGESSSPNKRLGAMGRSNTEHDMKIRSRRSMAVGPFEDLPPHIRQHMVRQHGFRMGEDGFLPGGLGPQHLMRDDNGLMFARRHDLEAQRELLVRRGFSPSHPYISGEVPVHPELQGQLPFGNPATRTIPLRPDDYQRFRPDLWLHPSHPNPVQFHDVALLQSELEVRRRRIAQQQQVQLMRRESQREREPKMGSSHNIRHPDPSNISGIGSNSPAMLSPAIENNFNSMPWEEILPKRMEHLHHQALQSVREMDEHQQRSRSQESRTRGNKSSKSSRPFAGLIGSSRNTEEARDDNSETGKSSWFGGKKEGKSKNKQNKRDKSSNIEDESNRGHWLLKEKKLDDSSLPPNMAASTNAISSERDIHQSMPPLNVGGGVGTLRDSGIGDDYPTPSRHGASKDSSNVNLHRNGTDRSSFGMILKDKFQRNPNMYFPGDHTNRTDEGRSSNSSGHSDRSGSRHREDIGGGGRRSNNSSNSAGSMSKTSGTCTTSATTSLIETERQRDRRQNEEELVAEMDIGMLSDTDTLIHNMSEGSFEDDGASGGQNSIGKESGKGSRVSSGTSSLSPHNSMEGSPRMIPKSHSSKKPSSSPNKSIASSNYTSSGARSLVALETTSSEGKRLKSNPTSDKKTIRNYTPKESSNMLKELENLRNNSVDWRTKQNKKSVANKQVAKSSPSEAKIMEEKSRSNGSTNLERKSSMDRMIEDFHRNLPPPPPDPRLASVAQSSLPNSSTNSSSNNGRTNSPSTKDKKKQESVPKHTGRDISPTKPDGSSAVPHPVTRQLLNSHSNKHGTLTSQVSNWSVASSSAASFDYQPGILPGSVPANVTSYNRRKSLSTDNLLPALSEVEYGSSKDNFGGNSPAELQSRIGERVPPEGCAAISSNSPQPQNTQPFVQRIEVKGSPSKPTPKKGERKIHEKKSENQSSRDKPSKEAEETDDEFSNLRKMIKEGRIAGLDAPPPSFIPPTPPSTSKLSFSSKSSVNASNSSSPKPNVPSNDVADARNSRSKVNQHSKLVERSSSSITGNQKQLNGPRRTNSNKPPAPATPTLNSDKTRAVSVSVTSLDKQRFSVGGARLGHGVSERSIASDLNNSGRTRKTKSEAPKPPGLVKTPSQKTPNAESFHARESLEDLTQMDVKRRNEIKRSASNHGNRPAQGFGKGTTEDSNIAKLIADSTEKKFNFNPFKGMLKKKHASFDFH